MAGSPQKPVVYDDDGKPTSGAQAAAPVVYDEEGRVVSGRPAISSLTGLERPKTTLPSWMTAGTDASVNRMQPEDMIKGAALTSMAVPVVMGGAEILAAPTLVARGVAAARTAAPYVTQWGLEKLGLSPGGAALVSMAIGARKPSIGRSASAGEAALSKEGQALATASRGTMSGTPKIGPIVETPRGGSVTVNQPPASSVSGVPSIGLIVEPPRGGMVSVRQPPSAAPASGSGIPAMRPVVPTPKGGTVTVPDRAATELERAQMASKFSEASNQRIMKSALDRVRSSDPEGFDASSMRTGGVKPRLNTAQSAEFLRQVKGGATQAQALARALMAKFGGEDHP